MFLFPLQDLKVSKNFNTSLPFGELLVCFVLFCKNSKHLAISGYL